MRRVLVDVVRAVNWGVVLYFLALNTSYLGLIVVGALRVVRNAASAGTEAANEIFTDPLAPAVSIIVPAHNEERVILDTVRAALALRYPCYELIVVDDGCTDRTFDLLAQAYPLVAVEHAPLVEVPVHGQVTGVYRSTAGESLTVIRKTGIGRRADALNAGLRLARHELVCTVDADSLLEPDALLRVVTPFVDDPARVVAVGGVVRVANGTLTDQGRVVEPRLGSRWLVRVQVVEYLRAFLFGRTGWANLGALLVISGAFGVFRRDVLVEVGGLDTNSLAEDAELVISLHRYLRDHGRDYRVAFVPEPVSWTEAPPTWRIFARQRRRWALGLSQLLWKHRGMIANPRYGRLGLLALPYHLVFELFGPLVELIGLATVVLAVVLGLLNHGLVLVVVLVAFGLGAFLSACAITLEELIFHRYRRGRDLAGLFLAALVENIGYRQVHAWSRTRGLAAALTRRPAVWQDMPRAGFPTSGP